MGRFLLGLACGSLSTGGLIAAGHALPGDRELPSLSDAEIAELAGLLQADWQTSLEAKFSVGHDSNLLLSSLTREESGFGRMSLEGMVWRPAREKMPVELVGFVNAGYRRMFSSRTMPEDTEALFLAEARWRPTPPVRLSLQAQGYYLDTVLDLSTESERLASPLRNSGIKAGVTARWEAGTHWWTEASGTANFSRFRQVPEDFDELVAGLRAGWQSGAGKLKLGVGARERDRRYRDRNATTIGGRPVPGTRLGYHAPEFEVNAEGIAEWRGTWKISGALATVRNDDNGSGYFDYRLWRFRSAIEWSRGPWEVQFSFEASRYRWDAQVAGIGLDPPRRRRSDRTVNLQLHRRINERWFVFVDAERDWVTSNDPAEGYNQTVLSTGMGWKI